MKNRKSTKRALTASIVSLVLCVAMLIGTTFAWFTSTASTKVNKIQAGNLKVDIVDEDGNSLQNTPLTWKKSSNAPKDEEILWEPGCTYELEPFYIKNDGNLALKYKIEITGITGDDKLNEVLDWTISEGTDKDSKFGTEYHLSAGQRSSEKFTISAYMRESAGNDYQNLSIDNVAVTVYATQYTEEYDSNDNQYDKDAEYATPVSTVDDLKAAVEAGENVVLQNDITTDETLKIPAGKEVIIDLNGKTVTSSKNFADANGGNLTLTGGTVKVTGVKTAVATATNNGSVVINGGTYINEKYIVLEATTGGEVTVNDGTFTSQESVGVALEKGRITINGGTFNAKDNFVIGTNGTTDWGKNEITINGGVFNGNITSVGYIACGVYVANNDTVNINGGTFNITDGVGVLMRAGNTTIGKDVVINLTNTGKITEGKIGDAKINIETPNYLVQDVRSGYPGVAAGFTITNNSTYELVTYNTTNN